MAPHARSAPISAPRVTVKVRYYSRSSNALEHPLCPARALTMLHRMHNIRVAPLLRGIELITHDASKCVFVPYSALRSARVSNSCLAFGSQRRLKLELSGGTKCVLTNFSTVEDLDFLIERIHRGMKRADGHVKIQMVADAVDYLVCTSNPASPRRISMPEKKEDRVPAPLPMVRTKSAPAADAEHSEIAQRNKDLHCFRHPLDLLVRATGDVPPRPLRSAELQLEHGVEFELANISVYEFFNLFYANDARGLFNAPDSEYHSISRWTPPDEESLQRRVVKARVAVPTPMGGSPTSSLVQNQWIVQFPSPDNPVLILEKDAVCGDVPMGSSFSSVEVWEVRQTDVGCKIVVKCGVNYYNRRFAAAKVLRPLIIRGAVQGAEQFARHAKAYINRYFAIVSKCSGNDLAVLLPDGEGDCGKETFVLPGGVTPETTTGEEEVEVEKEDYRDHESCVMDSFWW